MRAPVDFNLAVVQPVTPFAQRIGRKRQRSSVFAHAHSAPVHRLDMHRPERLHCTRLRMSVLTLKRRAGVVSALFLALHGASRGAIPSDIP